MISLLVIAGAGVLDVGKNGDRDLAGVDGSPSTMSWETTLPQQGSIFPITVSSAGIILGLRSHSADGLSRMTAAGSPEPE